MASKQPPTLCFVLILRFRNGKFYTVYYRPAPIDDVPEMWRFVPGMLQGVGDVAQKDAQARALVLANQLNALHHAIHGRLDCPPENVILDLVVDVPFMPAVIVLPPFGPGRKSLRERLEEGAQRVERKGQQLIVAPGVH